METLSQSWGERSVLRDELKDARLYKSLAYINGQWHSAEPMASAQVCNPADGSALGAVVCVSAAQSRMAVEVAHEAFASWSRELPQKRAQVLKRWHELMREHREDLALLMVYEQGKPLSEARGEIDYAASFLEYFSEEAKRLNIESVMSHLDNAEVELWREPLGVAALITPWNFPSAMLTRKAGAALAAGCTVVAHPALKTPFSALALAELAERAGMPPGVFNVLPGEAATVVEPWMQMPQVRALSFTGSTEVGKLLYRQSAETVKRLVLELGGHAPFLVFADADLQQAVRCAVAAKFATSGQDCLAANRILVQKDVYDEFCQRFIEETQKLKVGAGISDPDIGPLIDTQAVAKQQQQVDDALAQGARLGCGGQTLAQGERFYAPTVLLDVPVHARIFHEETFGPVAALASFDTEAQALQIANDSEYGLVAYVHTDSAQRIYRLTRSLSYGMVAVNRAKVTGAPIPFGGMKQSGLGREGARLGMEAFTEVKYVCRDYL